MAPLDPLYLVSDSTYMIYTIYIPLNFLLQIKLISSRCTSQYAYMHLYMNNMCPRSVKGGGGGFWFGFVVSITCGTLRAFEKQMKIVAWGTDRFYHLALD